MIRFGQVRVSRMAIFGNRDFAMAVGVFPPLEAETAPRKKTNHALPPTNIAPVKRSPADRFHIQGPPSGAMLAGVRVFPGASELMSKPNVIWVSFLFSWHLQKKTHPYVARLARTSYCTVTGSRLRLQQRCTHPALSKQHQKPSDLSLLQLNTRDSPESSSSPAQMHPSAAAHAHGLTQRTRDTSSRTQSFSEQLAICKAKGMGS